MKIGINASILDERPSGLGVYTINVISELVKLLDKNDYIIIFTSCPQYFEEKENIKIKLIPQNTQPQYGKNGAISRFIWCNFNLMKEIKNENIDILYSTTHHGPLFYRNQIITVHDLLPLHFNYKDTLQKILQTKYFKLILPRLINRAKKIITISDCTKNDIIKFYNIKDNKIVRIYNGYNSNLFIPKENAKEYIFNKYKVKDYIFAIGASYPHKNYDSLIKAFNLINDKKIMLVIAGGRYDYIIYLKKLAKELDLFDRIFFIDYLPEEDLPLMYNASKCLVYPSLYEGFGLPPLEAMACGCPVITSNTSSLPEVVGDAGIMVDPNNVNEIGKAIDLVLSNDNIRNEMIKKGLKQVKKFSWEITAYEIYKLIKELGDK